MKAGNGFKTWHSCMSVAVVGALALAVSVQGSPRAGERDKTDGKSGATRLVTGPSAHINDAIAAGPGATIAMVPINPTTIPASSYPAGSSISGSTLTLSSVPARTWWEYRITGWAPQGLKTAQVRHDSSGQMGSVADCAGGSAPR